MAYCNWVVLNKEGKPIGLTNLLGQGEPWDPNDPDHRLYEEFPNAVTVDRVHNFQSFENASGFASKHPGFRVGVLEFSWRGCGSPPTPEK